MCVTAGQVADAERTVGQVAAKLELTPLVNSVRPRQFPASFPGFSFQAFLSLLPGFPFLVFKVSSQGIPFLGSFWLTR
jgi:hypothetical protein